MYQHIIPFPQNRSFVGRTDELARLQQTLIVQKEWQTMALVGLGGVGKTQVALQFAYSVKAVWPQYSIFWTTATSVEGYSQACQAITRQLGWFYDKDNEDPKKQVQQFLNSGMTGKWILIIDNADDMDVIQGSPPGAGGISQYLPRTHEDGLILFTSRHMEAALSLVGNRILKINAMGQQDSLELFQKLSISNNKNGDDDAIKIELIEELTAHPLAMSQAIAYLNMTAISIREYLKLLRGTEEDFIALMSREFHDANQSNKPSAVATTWLVSFEQIHRKNPQAAKLLCYMSLIHHRAIPRKLLPKFKTQEETTFALGVLTSYAFITRRGDSDIYDIHRLVHIAAKLWIQKEHISEAMIDDLADQIRDVFLSIDYGDRSVGRGYLPHAIHLVRENEPQSQWEKYELYYHIGAFLSNDGRASDSIGWLQEVLDWRQETGTDYEAQDVQHALVRAYNRNGQLKKALELFEFVIDAVLMLEEDDPELLARRIEFASLYRRDGDASTAIDILEQVVEIQRQSGVYDPEAQHELGLAYVDIKQAEKAVELLERVVTDQQNLPQDDPDRVGSEAALALAYEANSQLTEAITLQEYVVMKRARSLPEYHQDRLFSEHDLAVMYDDVGRLVEAIKLIDHVVAVEAKSLPQGHVNRVDSEELQKYLHRKYTEQMTRPSGPNLGALPKRRRGSSFARTSLPLRKKLREDSANQ